MFPIRKGWFPRQNRQKWNHLRFLAYHDHGPQRKIAILRTLVLNISYCQIENPAINLHREPLVDLGGPDSVTAGRFLSPGRHDPLHFGSAPRALESEEIENNTGRTGKHTTTYFINLQSTCKSGRDSILRSASICLPQCHKLHCHELSGSASAHHTCLGLCSTALLAFKIPPRYELFNS